MRSAFPKKCGLFLDPEVPNLDCNLHKQTSQVRLNALSASIRGLQFSLQKKMCSVRKQSEHIALCLRVELVTKALVFFFGETSLVFCVHSGLLALQTTLFEVYKEY